jgi:methylated-DNA-[protein]-cysteine S-methyltransferase
VKEPTSPPTAIARIVSPVGPLEVAVRVARVVSIRMEEQGFLSSLPRPEGALSGADGEVLGETVRQLEAYFAGRLTRFELPLALSGTPLQERVWRALLTIPYGETVAYSDVARDVSAERAVRAVGGAIGKNPVGIVVPCHRVVGKSGAITGYAGGVANKVWLLAHEARARGEGPLFTRRS